MNPIFLDGRTIPINCRSRRAMAQSACSKINTHRARRPAVLAGHHAETALSILWSATIHCIESKQNLAGLAPKDCFVSAKSVERVAGQIGQTQKATCKLGCGIKGFRPRAGPDFRSICVAVRYAISLSHERWSTVSGHGDVKSGSEATSLFFDFPVSTSN